MNWMRRGLYACYCALKRRIVKFWSAPNKVEAKTKRFYEKIKRIKGSEQFAVFTGPGIGDVLYAMAFLSPFLQHRRLCIPKRTCAGQ